MPCPPPGPLPTPAWYAAKRAAYRYTDAIFTFTITQTGGLPVAVVNTFTGIYTGVPPAPTDVSIRGLETIVQAVFVDCAAADAAGRFRPSHLGNLKAVSSAIVFWKMASQGGRAPLKVANMLGKWTPATAPQLLKAYAAMNIKSFQIGGVLIATASAFLRFINPNLYGIVDSHVADCTNSHNITAFGLRDNDNYVNNTNRNRTQYILKYIPFLRKEAARINGLGATYLDPTIPGPQLFRACDIEMAMW